MSREITLSESVKAEIDKWIAKYPLEHKQSALLPALHIIQDANDGWLSDELLEATAKYFGIPKISVYEVATFYSMYDLKPTARHKIELCTNVSCMLRGSEEIQKYIEKKLNIKSGETTIDGKFLFREVECLAACKNAPAMMIGKEYHENLTVDKLDEILDGLE